MKNSMDSINNDYEDRQISVVFVELIILKLLFKKSKGKKTL